MPVTFVPKSSKRWMSRGFGLVDEGWIRYNSGAVPMVVSIEPSGLTARFYSTSLGQPFPSLVSVE